MKKILIIDDDFDLSNIIKSLLEYNGYTALVSHTSEDGIDMAKKSQPHLILMDVMLPGMNGAEAVKLLKSYEILSKIPIIFLTGLVSNSDLDLAQQGLVVDGIKYETLAKPFDNEKLLTMIKKYF